MTLQEHLIKGSSDFMDKNFALNVTHLPGLVAIGTVVVEMFLIHYVASCDHVFKEFCKVVGGNFS